MKLILLWLNNNQTMLTTVNRWWIVTSGICWYLSVPAVFRFQIRTFVNSVQTDEIFNISAIIRLKCTLQYILKKICNWKQVPKIPVQYVLFSDWYTERRLVGVCSNRGKNIHNICCFDHEIYAIFQSNANIFRVKKYVEYAHSFFEEDL